MGIEELRKEILEEAEKKIKEILAEAEVEAKKIVEDAEKKASQIIESRRESVLKSLREKERSELAIARIEGKRLIHNKKWDLVNEVFEKVIEKLREFRESKEYEDVLVNYIADAVKHLNIDKVLVTVNEDDHKMLKQKLKSIEKKVSKLVGKNVSLKLSDKKLRIIGGVIVTDMDEMIIYNNSFEARVGAAKEELAADVLNMLFGEGM